jgi:hypothetical protein
MRVYLGTLPATENKTAEVVIARNSDKDIKFRGLEVFVDGQFARDLSFNDSFSVDLPEGAHTILVSNHLYKKSVQLDLKQGDRVELVAGNNFTLIGGLMVSVFGIGPYRVFLQRESQVTAPAA